MKKLLAFVLTFGMVCVLGTGLVGCTKTETTKKDEKKTVTTETKDKATETKTEVKSEKVEVKDKDKEVKK